MKKKLLAIVFALFAVHAAVWAQSGYCGDPNVNGGKDVMWELEYNTLIISGTGDMASWDDLDARPWASFANSIQEVIIDGVTSVGAGAFAKCENLTSVHGSLIKSIGDGAFLGCINLKIDPEIIADADWIGVGAFAECHSLEGFDESEYGGGHSMLYLTASLVGEGAFMNCPKIDWVDLIGENQEIDRGAFYGCTGLKTLVVGTGVKSIGREAFADCDNLVKVKVEAPVPPVLGEDVFGGIHQDVEFIIDENLGVEVMIAYANSDWAKYFDVLSTTVESGYCGDRNVNEGKDVIWKLSLGGVLTISGNGAMETNVYNSHWGFFEESPWSDSDFSSVVIKEGVTNVGVRAFGECEGLKSVELPKSCTIVGDSAFYGCVALDSIVIPEGVTEIGEGTFYGCVSLKSVILPQTLEKIGANAFKACLELATITIPEGVTEISAETFAACLSLKSITLPKTLVNIESFAFAECHELATIVIPENVVSIAGSVFDYCPKLSEVTCLNPIPPVLGEDSFIAISSAAILRVPEVEAYKASDWSQYFPTIVDLNTDLSGINNLKIDDNKSVGIYDLGGRSVKNPIKGCIYIVNGKVTMW